MALKTRIIPYTLRFKQPAGTSRGVYTEHAVWYVVLYDSLHPKHWGIGECAPLVQLSCDDLPDYEVRLRRFCDLLEEGLLDKEMLRPYPSMLFGLETAFRHYHQESFALWETPFAKGETGIPINGLIWMGRPEEMLKQVEDKINRGFHCIKLKIGALDFELEYRLLQQIRQHFPAEEITLRVDANGGFSTTEAPERLKQLAELELHSIEQPIRAGKWKEMATLCKETPLPIGLDEELIGIHNRAHKANLLDTIRPQFIILKPSLHGGISGSAEWIELAEARGIGWWITSALESNVGLNAIAQWCATLRTSLPQGLGTGALYTNNLEMPLAIEGENLWFHPERPALTLESL